MLQAICMTRFGGAINNKLTNVAVLTKRLKTPQPKTFKYLSLKFYGTIAI